ncbi:MAG: aminotransferase class V-fold PLP-dependent enzyme [Gorillibacterium sp.]|nr:aminotransferase class V-fold PLP-dependent enzyme [Gorillibacterium sp.]
MKGYYFDHAASSWPKPPQVTEAMVKWMEGNGANPGRGGHHLAMEASRAIYRCRVSLAQLFNIANPNDISFTANATEALNLAIKGFLRRGDHVISTELEHNSVRRPLEWVSQEKQVEITYVPADKQGRIQLNEVNKAFRNNTKLLVCSHASNLLGSILPVQKLGEMCKAKGVRLLVDAAQTAGTYPIDVESMGIDMLAFPGHKGLLGPQGTGGLYIHPDLEVEPLFHGGTGSQSEEIQQPNIRPDRYEAGTRNTVGLVGLDQGVRFIMQETIAEIREKESRMIRVLLNGLSILNGVTCFGPPIGEERVGIAAFTLRDKDPAEVAHQLDRRYNIAVRAGYHCTPLGHKTAGTLETGAIRASIGYLTTIDEIEYLLDAVGKIMKND